MLSPAEEAEVLRLAVAQGHLRAERLSALASSEGDDTPAPTTLGPRIERLIAQGHLLRATAASLAQRVQSAAQEQTAPPSAPDANPGAGPVPVQADVDRGLALVDRLLTKAPKWPRALAAQGLLLLVRAKGTRGAVAKQAAQQAAAAMRLMGQGNPLLLKFYAREIADIDRLAGPSVKSLTSL